MPAPRLSIVVPALDAAATLPACLAAARAEAPAGTEIVVVDGGSRDGTPDLAARTGAKVFRMAPGRGGQLRAGAEAARGDWLLFLHADTALAAGWAAAARAFMDDPANAERAAAFRLVLDDPAAPARRIERWAGWRARRLGLPYGDQGLLLSRALYQRVGGFRDLPLMEDVDLARRLGRERLALLDVAAVTSAGRYRRGGYWVRPARNLACLALYYLGVPPHLLVRLYG